MVAQKYNFPITAGGEMSKAFLERGVTDFSSAAEYVRDLPYGRNADKLNLLTVFTDGCATCSTKHGLLKVLADENVLFASQHPPSPLQRVLIPNYT